MIAKWGRWRVGAFRVVYWQVFSLVLMKIHWENPFPLYQKMTDSFLCYCKLSLVFVLWTRWMAGGISRAASARGVPVGHRRETVGFRDAGAWFHCRHLRKLTLSHRLQNFVFGAVNSTSVMYFTVPLGQEKCCIGLFIKSFGTNNLVTIYVMTT